MELRIISTNTSDWESYKERIDLHTHSTASDGSVAPGALPGMAVDHGLAALALTDHDTVSGLDAFMDGCVRVGIRGIPGIEISSQGPGEGEIHILGYFVSMTNRNFLSGVASLQAARNERNREMIRKLQGHGCPVTMADWEVEASGDILGRLHLANLLVEKGWVAHHGEAFSRWIGRSGKAFVPKERWTATHAVHFLREAGALPVLAHPALYRSHIPDIHQFLILLKGQGLVGVECIHSDHSERDVVRYQTLAAKLGLLPTGGSDFHGHRKPHVKLGKPAVPMDWLSALESFRSSM